MLVPVSPSAIVACSRSALGHSESLGRLRLLLLGGRDVKATNEMMLFMDWSYGHI